MPLSPTETYRLNYQLDTDERFESSFDAFLDQTGKRELVYDADRFVD
jgi:hypothetical protein